MPEGSPDVLEGFYRRLFPSWIEKVKSELRGCGSVLDLGCGSDSPIKHCSIPFSVGVDSFGPSVQRSRAKGIHAQYIRADIRKLEFKPKSFDAVVAIEVLEQLTKSEGVDLIVRMGEWARTKAVVTTPNGFICQDSYDNNPFQEHRSGWSSDELSSMGFEVYGINGWKRLRGCQGSIRYRPVFLWARLAVYSQRLVHYHPQMAFQLLAIRTVEESIGARTRQPEAAP